MPSASDRGRRLALAVALATTSAAGCARPFEVAPVLSRQVTADPTLRVGVARVDITPAPGLALFGHGPEGRVSRGILTRLRCHAFAMSSGTEAVVIVPCDLAAPSLLLQRSIARELAARFPDVPLGVDRIVLAATHTHAGPAHFFGASNYAGPLTSRQPQGTSKVVVDGLARAIAGSIAEAWTARRPARLGWHHASVHGLTRNRSMDAFARNAPTGGPADDDPVAGFVDRALRAHRPAQAAIDPALSVMRIDAADGDREPLGAIAVFGVHPTGVSNLNDLYHGDLFGAASRAVFEREGDRLCGDLCPPVAFVNGLSGDVSPIVDFQGPREARRWARDFAGFVREAWEDAAPALDAGARVEVAYRELELVSAAAAPLGEVLGPPPPGGGPRLVPGWVTPCACEGARTCGLPPPRATGQAATCACLCDHASVGAAASGGAEDGRTAFSFIDGFREGSRVERDACQAPKNEIVGLGECGDTFPHRVPLWSVRLGSALLATFPAEVTTVAGKRAVARVEADIAQRATGHGDAALRVVPATLVGDWLQYVATEEEYPSQQYEGASTLWGPASARFFARQAGCLAGWLVDHAPGREARDAICRLGQPPPFRTAEVIFRAPVADVAPRPRTCESKAEPDLCPAPGFMADLTGLVPCERRPTPAVRDGERGIQATFFPPAGCASERHVPRAAIVGPQGALIDDDEGDGFELRAFPLGIGGHAGQRGLEVLPPAWLVSWFPDARARARACAAGRVRLRVTLDRRNPSPIGRLVDPPGILPPLVAPIAIESEPFDACP